MTCQQISYTHGTAGNFAVGLLSNNVLLCQTSRASRQRHRWNHRLHYWHRNSSRSSLQWQNAVHCHCLTPRVIDVWPRRWRLLVSVDDKGVVAGMSFRCTLRSRPPGFVLRRQGTQQTAWSGWTTPTGSFLEGGTASVVLVAIRGRRLWYDVGGVGG